MQSKKVDILLLLHKKRNNNLLQNNYHLVLSEFVMVGIKAQNTYLVNVILDFFAIFHFNENIYNQIEIPKPAIAKNK